MPNHVHLIVVPESADGLRVGVGEVRGTFVRLVERKVGEAWYLGIVVQQVEGNRLTLVEELRKVD